MAFAYIGPTLSLKSDKGLTLWLSPQLVGMFNFFDGHDSVGPSLWSVLDSGRWSVFLEGEFYFGSDHRRAYYGFYAADTRLRGWANLGVHSEQVDKVLSCGPHIGGDAGSSIWSSSITTSPRSTHKRAASSHRCGFELHHATYLAPLEKSVARFLLTDSAFCAIVPVL